jgi:hypothetical protein
MALVEKNFHELAVGDVVHHKTHVLRVVSVTRDVPDWTHLHNAVLRRQGAQLGQTDDLPARTKTVVTWEDTGAGEPSSEVQPWAVAHHTEDSGSLVHVEGPDQP